MSVKGEIIMISEKLQSFSIGTNDESQSFIVPVEKNEEITLKAFFVAFNVRIKEKVYKLNFQLIDENNNIVFKNQYNLNTEEASFVAKNIIQGEYGSSGFQFSIQTSLQTNCSYEASLILLDENGKSLSEVVTFFNTTKKDH